MSIFPAHNWQPVLIPNPPDAVTVLDASTEKPGHLSGVSAAATIDSFRDAPEGGRLSIGQLLPGQSIDVTEPVTLLGASSVLVGTG